MLVVDASVVVAALHGPSAEGAWAEAEVSVGGLHAPDVLPYEVTSVLRRMVLAGKTSEARARAALEDYRALPVVLVPFEGLAERVWELRHNVAVYDAAYVALAEQLGAPLATLDEKLAQATGPRCGFRTP